MYQYIYGEVPEIPAILEEINMEGWEVVSVFYSADSRQVHFIVNAKREEAPEEIEEPRLFGKLT